jgi:hypothetical protein
MRWILLALLVLYMGFRCPVDDMLMYFTGQTVLQMGRLFMVYRCPMGHETLVRQ